MNQLTKVSRDNVVSFDYDAIKPELRGEVQGHAEQIRVLFERTASNVIAIGKHLDAVKSRLTYKLFVRWLYAELDLSPTSALRYIQIAKRFGDLPKGQLDKFQPMALGLLVNGKVPQKATDEALRRARAGERITWGKAHEIIHEHRPKRERALKDRDRGKISAALTKVTKDRTPRELREVIDELDRHKSRLESVAGRPSSNGRGAGPSANGHAEAGVQANGEPASAASMAPDRPDVPATDRRVYTLCIVTTRALTGRDLRALQTFVENQLRDELDDAGLEVQPITAEAENA